MGNLTSTLSITSTVSMKIVDRVNGLLILNFIPISGGYYLSIMRMYLYSRTLSDLFPLSAYIYPRLLMPSPKRVQVFLGTGILCNTNSHSAQYSLHGHL